MASENQKTALVVEDDDQIAYLLRFILEREGYRVELAPDGRAAQELIESMQPPALAMLDVMLPHVDGYQLLGMIRARETWQAVPVQRKTRVPSFTVSVFANGSTAPVLPSTTLFG